MRTVPCRPRWPPPLSAGARSRLGADIGIGITGIVGPRRRQARRSRSAPSASSVSSGDDSEGAHRPGARRAVRLVRDRTTTVALHMLRALLAADVSALRLFVALDLPGGGTRLRSPRCGARRGWGAVWRPGPPQVAARHARVPLARGRRSRTWALIEPVVTAVGGDCAPRLAFDECLCCSPPRRVSRADRRSLEGPGRDACRAPGPCGRFARGRRRLHAREAAVSSARDRRPAALRACVRRARLDLPGSGRQEFSGEAVTLYVSRLHPLRLALRTARPRPRWR